MDCQYWCECLTVAGLSRALDRAVRIKWRFYLFYFFFVEVVGRAKHNYTGFQNAGCFLFVYFRVLLFCPNHYYFVRYFFSFFGCIIIIIRLFFISFSLPLVMHSDFHFTGDFRNGNQQEGNVLRNCQQMAQPVRAKIWLLWKQTTQNTRVILFFLERFFSIVG